MPFDYRRALEAAKTEELNPADDENQVAISV
jgi:hypothetical protein